MIHVVLPFLEFLLELVESRHFYYSFTGDACSDTIGCFLYIVSFCCCCCCFRRRRRHCCCVHVDVNVVFVVVVALLR